MPGAFKLDHLQLFKPILFGEMLNFFTFILGTVAYYKNKRADNWKRELQTWMRQGFFSGWGLQIGSLAVL